MQAFIHNVQSVSLDTKVQAVFRLSRWREHVPFTLPLTLVGALLASELNTQPLDWRLVLVVIANILAMSFAFIINDVVDAPDDALNPKKKLHNVISSELLTAREGMAIAMLTAMIALALYAFCGAWTIVWGAIILILSYFYSSKPLRLKARPVTDVVSHALMLSGLLVMAGYFIYDSTPDIAWFVIAAATLFSAYGQFYNQIDDYDTDKKAGLKNTVVLLGKTGTTLLMFGALIGAAVCMGIAILNGLFPAWLGVVMLVGFLICLLFTWETDMRGNPTSGTGAAQKPTLLVANLVAILWLLAAIGVFNL